MPPKIVKPPPRAKTSQAASKNIKKNVQTRGLKKGIKVEIPEPEPEPEPIIVVEEKPKRPAWLDTLPPVIKEDEELHKELSRKRKEETKRKHQDHCYTELTAILDFAFFSLENKEDPKAIRRARIDFQNGKFYDDVVGRQLASMPPAIDIPSITPTPFSADSLISVYAPTFEESNKALKEILSGGQNLYDGNNEMDKLFKIMYNGMQKYIQPQEEHELQPFPYMISIVGPQCSGKTTVAQFLQTIYQIKIVKVIYTQENFDEISNENFVVIHGGDDKQLAATIYDIMINTPEDQGIVLVGYPNTKNQLTILNKNIATSSRSKMSRINGITALIHMDLNHAQCVKNSEHRLLGSDKRIYSEEFFPSSALGIFNEHIAVTQRPCQFEQSYIKLISGIQTIEKAIKKDTGFVLQVKACDFVGNVMVQVEKLINQILHTHNTTPPNYRGFRFETLQSYKFSKFCNDLWLLWEKDVMLDFSEPLAQEYSNYRALRDSIPEMVKSTREKFSLRINIYDKRQKYTDDFIRGYLKPDEYFNAIWDSSNAARDKHISEIQKVINESGLKSIEKINCGSEYHVFDALIKRFFTIKWFYNQYHFSLEKPDSPPVQIVKPELPDYNSKDLASIAKLMQEDKRSEDMPLPPERCPTSEYLVDIPASEDQTNKSKKSHKIIQPAPNKQHLPINRHKSQYAMVGSLNKEATHLKKLPSSIPQQLPPISTEISTSDPIVSEKPMRVFIDWISNNVKTPLLIEETRIMGELFDYLSSEKNAVFELINQAINGLEIEFRKVVEMKYTREMENFSSKILAFNSDHTMMPLFEYDKSDVDDEILEIVKKSGIPDPGHPTHLNVRNMGRLFDAIHENHYVTLDELLTEAKNVGFNEEAVSELHLIALMLFHPRMIEILPLFIKVMPDVLKNFNERETPTRPMTSFARVKPNFVI